MTPSTKTVYDEVYGFCLKNGLINSLKKSFKTNEETDFNKLHISKNGLRVLDAVHCVYDKRRSMFFLREIDRLISPGAIVVEAGIGTGILSFFASTKGAKVYAYEINRAILKLAMQIKDYLIKRGIYLATPFSLLLRDATRITLPQKIDLIISENIYTGMFFEKQVQIINHLLKYLKRGGSVVPAGLNSFIVLSHTEFPHPAKQKELFVPSPERKVSFHSKSLSKAVSYDSLNFKTKLPTQLKKSLKINIEKTGTINSLLIYSEVLMPSSVIIKRKDTTFLNSDIIIAVKPLMVKVGDEVKLDISYKYGSRPQEAKIELTKE